MSEQRSPIGLRNISVELLSNVQKHSPEGSLSHTICTNMLNERKAFLDSELRAAIIEAQSSEDIDHELYEKLSTVCADIADRYNFSPEQLSRVMDEIYEDEQTIIYD